MRLGVDGIDHCAAAACMRTLLARRLSARAQLLDEHPHVLVLETVELGKRIDARADRRRLVFSMDGLPEQRELQVYESERSDAAHLGSIVVTAAHKLSDLPQLLKAELDVRSSSVQLLRGTVGEKLKVPLHKKQYRRLALPFFPSEEHHLIVVLDGK